MRTYRSGSTCKGMSEIDNEKNKNRKMSVFVTTDTFHGRKIKIPETEFTGFSFRKLLAFAGPGFLVSIAYLDPGNIESDLQSGSIAQYKLLWILLISTCLGLFMQTLAAKLGIVSGMHLAEICYYQYRKIPRFVVWIMVEVAVIGSDIQEIIGTAIAIYMLSNRVIPLWGGCLITIVDTITFLLLDNFGLRILEFFFIILISVMGISFGYEYVIAGPNQSEVLQGMFVPWCSNCDSTVWLQAVGVVGAVIMPHNFYLHSALVKSRDIDRNKHEKIEDARLYNFIENAIALLVSFIINTFVVSVFGYGLYQTTGNEAIANCEAKGINVTGIFEANDEYISADLYIGGIFLSCTFGMAAMYIWAIGLLACGQSSTMSGTYTGQFTMEGFLNLKISRWKRILITRNIAIIPTFFIAFFNNIEDMTRMNDIINILMSIQLPFAALPLIAATSNTALMGKYANSRSTKISALMLSVVIFFMNLYSVYASFDSTMAWYWSLLLYIGVVLYIIIIIYLFVHTLTYLDSKRISKINFIKKYVLVEEEKIKLWGSN
ncbi:protein Malvolio-like [Agrilus planipennis]|uniref:Protein Malvolio-like n=1 Tax=Agrilus planipennis TaxID=224129 RepID=A0A1W4WRI1_AGRPL|nr:protein Malvolio-like [Agrilus planipennis]